MYTYPDPNRDDPHHVLGLLGSLWTHYYGGKAPLLAMVQGNLELLKQNKQNVAEAAACACRFTVPLYHTSNWVLIKVPFAHGLTEIAPKPPGLVHLPLMVNRLTDSTMMLQEGLDYVIDGDEILFDYCLFSDERVGREDKTAYMWGYNGQFDCDLVSRCFGYIMGVDADGATPARHRDTINAIIDCAVQGGTLTGLEGVLAAILGVPLADGEEIVEGVAEDRRGRFLITSAHVHRIAKDDVLRHPEGSQPPSGAPLLDTFRVMELHQAPDAITDVKIPARMTNAKEDIVIPVDELEISSCVLIQIAPELVNERLLDLIGRVLPPQTGVAFAELHGGN